MKPAAGLGAREAEFIPSHVRSVAAEPHAPRPATALETDRGPATGLEPSVPREGVIARMKESVWMPVAGKAVAIFAGMLALAGVGAWSTLQGSGVPLAMASGHSPVTPPGEAPVPLAASATANPPAPPSASAAPPSSAAPGAASPPEVSGIAPDGRVILNLATADELTRLPRVGAKRAENIVALRKKLGRFRQPTDLLRVKGIGRKTLQLMLPKLVLDAPKPETPKPDAPKPGAPAK